MIQHPTDGIVQPSGNFPSGFSKWPSLWRDSKWERFDGILPLILSVWRRSLCCAAFRASLRRRSPAGVRVLGARALLPRGRYSSALLTAVVANGCRRLCPLSEAMFLFRPNVEPRAGSSGVLG